MVVLGSACEAASCTSRSGTPASSAAVVNACLKVCGPMGLPIPARRATRRTMRPAPCRSSRRPSPLRKIGLSQRSPTARSIARAPATRAGAHARSVCAKSAESDRSRLDARSARVHLAGYRLRALLPAGLRLRPGQPGAGQQAGSSLPLLCSGPSRLNPRRPPARRRPRWSPSGIRFTASPRLKPCRPCREPRREQAG